MESILNTQQKETKRLIFFNNQWISGNDFFALVERFNKLLDSLLIQEGQTMVLIDTDYIKMLAASLVLFEKKINVLFAGTEIRQEKAIYAKQYGQFIYNGSEIIENNPISENVITNTSIMECYINQTGEYAIQSISCDILKGRINNGLVDNDFNEIICYGKFSGIDILYMMCIAFHFEVPILFLEAGSEIPTDITKAFMLANTADLVGNMPVSSQKIHTIIMNGIVPTIDIIAVLDPDIRWLYRLVGPGVYYDLFYTINAQGVIIYKDQLPKELSIEVCDNIAQIYFINDKSSDGSEYIGYKMEILGDSYRLLENERQDCFCTADDRVFYSGLEKIMQKHKLVDYGGIIVRLYEDKFYLDAYYMPTAYKLLVNDLQFYLLKFISDNLPIQNIVRMSELPTDSKGNLSRENFPIPYNKLKNTDFSDLIDDNITNRVFTLFQSNNIGSLTYDDFNRSFTELGVNSLMFVDISVQLEDEFDIIFDDEMLDVEYYEHIGELIRHIKNLVSKQNSI